MDRWKYYYIIHQRHIVMNPVDETKLEHLYDLLELKPNATVIHFGCGKGEMLIRLVEKYDIKGLGIDQSPYCVREAEKRKRQRVPGIPTSRNCWHVIRRRESLISDGGGRS